MPRRDRQINNLPSGRRFGEGQRRLCLIQAPCGLIEEHRRDRGPIDRNSAACQTVEEHRCWSALIGLQRRCFGSFDSKTQGRLCPHISLINRYRGPVGPKGPRERGGREAPDVLRQQHEGRAQLRAAVSAGSRPPGREGVTRMVQVRGKSAGRRVLPLPHRCLEVFNGIQKIMVGRDGIEPPTPGFSDPSPSPPSDT